MTEKQSKLRITRAPHAGFCMGVKRTVQLAEKHLNQKGNLYCLRPLVHNEIVMEQLKSRGLILLDNLDTLSPGERLLLQAHGTLQKEIEKARKQELQIIDGTCPLVYEIHQYARELESEGRNVIIIGDKGHEEVRAIADQVKSPIIISSQEDAEELSRFKKAGVVVQSTQDFEKVAEILKILANKIIDLRIINTICAPTRLRQEEVRELASNNDLVLIIGSRTSANTRRLYEIAHEINPRSYWIQNYKEIDWRWFKGHQRIGITAGASTPESVIQKVEAELEEKLG